MKKLVYIICLLTASLYVFAVGSVTIKWDHSVSTPVNSYRIYYGNSSRSYSNSVSVPYINLTTLNGLTEGQTYFFAITAMTTNALGATLESDFGTEFTYKVPTVVTNPLPKPTSRPSGVQDFTILKVR